MTREISPTVGDVGTFNIQLAIDLGDVDLAIICQFFLNTIAQHKREGRHQIEGRTWNYCSRAELVAYFPYWNEDKIKRKLRNLIDRGILIVGSFNKRNWDKTNWYAFADEEKWGISKISYVGRNRPMDRVDPPNGLGENAQPIPQTNHRPTPSIYNVNDRVDGSVTPSIEGKKSVYKGKAKYTEDQKDTFEWLKSLNLDTSDATLSWWARNYTLSRLDEVHREATKRKPKSLGAYMQKLLKQGSVVVSGRVELNAGFAKIFKEYKNWHALEIHKKYASINRGNHNIEIDFNMEPEAFKDYLSQKYDTFEGGA